MPASEIELRDWPANDLAIQVGPPAAPISSNNGGLDLWDSDPAIQGGQSPAYFSRGQSVQKPLIITCGPLIDPVYHLPWRYSLFVSLHQFWSNAESPEFAPVLKDFDLYERKREFAKSYFYTDEHGLRLKWPLSMLKPSEIRRHEIQVSQESPNPRRIDITDDDAAALRSKSVISSYHDGNNLHNELILTLYQFPAVVTAHNDDKTMRVLEIQIAPYDDAPASKLLSFFVACVSAGG